MKETMKMRIARMARTPVPMNKLGFILLGMLLAACTDITSTDEIRPTDESVDSSKLYPVKFVVGGYYPSVEFTTRATADDDTETTDESGDTDETDALLNSILKTKEKSSFDEGTTLRILVEQWVNDEWVAMDASLSVPYVIQSVITSTGKTSDLIPCTVYDDGTLKATLSGKILYLSPGQYRVRAISPALVPYDELDADGNISTPNLVKVTNGMTLLANYDNCEVTTPYVIQETEFTEHYIQEIQLKPLIHQTAHLEFHISPEEASKKYIYSIQAMENGCVISGLQGERGYNWTANKPNWVIYLNDKTTAWTIKDSEFNQTSDTELSCGAHILPTSVESTTIYVTFNLRINGVPTQFMTSISDRQFRLGFNYPFNVHISISGDVTIAPWINSVTSTTIQTTPTTATSE